MSKSAKKDKKNDATSGLELAYENQKRQLFDYQFSIKKLNQRIIDITQQNLRLKKFLSESVQSYNESIEQIKLKKQKSEQRVIELSNKKTKLEIENEQKQNKIKLLEKKLFDQQQLRYKEMEQIKKNYHFQIAKFQSQLSEYKFYMNERDQLQHDRQQLRQRIEMQKANKLREIADKQRQKVQATDKLKDEMIHKVNDMRKNLFSLKRDQLSTTTRLTMLQNHQLTSQLQYQSKQTEKLIFKNEESQKKMTGLKQQLQIHKEVEEELAKRAHFSKGVIRKLNLKVNQLQAQVQRLKTESCLPKNGCDPTIQNRSILNQIIQQSHHKVPISDPSKSLINTLQAELERSEKRYVELLTRHSSAQKDIQNLTRRLQVNEEKSNQIFKILLKGYENLMANRTQQQQNQGDHYKADLSGFRSTPVDQWTSANLSFALQVLLNIVRPYLNRSNIMIPAVRKNLIIQQGIQSQLDVSSKSLPKLSATERVDSLNKLNQIPVNIASKIVGSNLRDWGQTVKISKVCLKRKYKLSQSYRA